MPTTYVTIIAIITWRPLMRRENRPHTDGMNSGAMTMVRIVTTTRSAPPIRGMSSAMAMMATPKATVKMRPALMRLLSDASGRAAP